jgi:hypothetical protein
VAEVVAKADLPGEIEQVFPFAALDQLAKREVHELPFRLDSRQRDGLPDEIIVQIDVGSHLG